MAEGTCPVLRFFGGKGGVGKTTCAAAWAVGRAEAGGRVLVASTDPAHSLGDALGVELGAEAVEVAVGEGRLVAVEMAGPAAYRRWLGERREAFLAIAERGSLLDRGQAERLLDLPMPGADELVGLIEVLRLAEAAGVAEVVVDTAPTGHTLRLLSSPDVLRRLAALLAALDERHRVLAETFGGGAAAAGADAAGEALARLEEDARRLGELLRDPERSALVWVSLPEALAVAEARDALAELARQGVAVREVVVNRWPAAAGQGGDGARRRAERAAVAELVGLAPAAGFRAVPERPAEPRGVAALGEIAALLAAPPRSGEELLRTIDAGPGGEAPSGWSGERRSAEQMDEVGGERRGRAAAVSAPETSERAVAGRRDSPTDWPDGVAPQGIGEQAPLPPAPPPWLDDLVPPGLALLFVGGKGGVGKTTCAAAVALVAAAARPEREVRAVSVDPAHSLGDVLAAPLGDAPRPVPGAPPNLHAREVDAPAAWEALRRRFAGELDRLLAWGDGRRGAAASLDREALARLLEATPPGLDELVALVELVEAAGVTGAADEGSAGPAAGAATAAAPLVVVDTAPTGHALRLLEMPEVALAWVQALMSVLLDLREALGLGDLAAELVSLSRRLRAFRALLADPARCRFLLVTRAGELPRRESERLVAALGRLGVALAGVVVDAADAATRDEAPRDAAGRPTLLAPAVSPPPRGVEALLAWARTWRRGEEERSARPL